MAPGRGLATAAFLLLLTSLLLPWYLVRNMGPTGEVYEQMGAAPFRPGGVAVAWPVHAVGGLLVLVALVLFIRLAARSDEYEPPLWRRDLGLGAVGVAVAALAAALLWPGPFDAWWTVLQYEEASVRVLPGLGWWLAWVVAAALGVAWRLAPASNEK